MISGCLITQVFAESVHKANVEVELISDVLTITPGRTFWVGLHMTMDEGWHTYWRNSGDSGLPTDIQWYLPKGFGAGDIQWSYPKRFDYSQGMSGYGYDGQVILLTEIWPPEDFPDDEEFQINAQVRWLSCEEICVPGIAHFSLSLTANKGETQFNERNHHLFMAEKQKWPVLLDAWRITAFDQDDAYVLNIIPGTEISHDMTDLIFFPYRNDIIDHSAQQKFDLVKGGYRLTIPKTVMLEKKIQNIQGILVSSQGWGNESLEQALFFDAPVTGK